LDTLGAIGIARSYIWVGIHHANIYSDIDIGTYIEKNLGGKINGRIQDKTKHSPNIEFETQLKIFNPKTLYG